MRIMYFASSNARPATTTPATTSMIWCCFKKSVESVMSPVQIPNPNLTNAFFPISDILTKKNSSQANVMCIDGNVLFGLSIEYVSCTNQSDTPETAISGLG